MYIKPIPSFEEIEDIFNGSGPKHTSGILTDDYYTSDRQSVPERE